MTPGRTCPLHYRYPPSVLNRDADIRAETIYVIGGLYGNRSALDAILALAAQEAIPPTLVFNGDFNWFNIDAAGFKAVNDEVLKHAALRGNVETELAADADEAGCGCAYPDYVDDIDVERSNEIMRALRKTARQFPGLSQAASQLPMHAVAEVGGQRFGIVHGDAESLSGWRFAHDALHETANIEWLKKVCGDARLAGFASSHTCLPTFRRYTRAEVTVFVINNGAAGMPNFSHTQYGLISRISIHPAQEGLAQYGAALNGVHIDALPVHYDHAQFTRDFLAQWPPGSPAHDSYFKRIVDGPAFASPHALGLIRAPSFCA